MGNFDRNNRSKNDEERLGDLPSLISSLHEVFEKDRSVASQLNSARCGICYLYYPQSDLKYREEEGFYICPSCQQSLGQSRINMVRIQQR